MEKFTIASQLLQYVFTGLTVGSIYALVGLGFNIIYNATEVINFAQGEFFMLGSMIMVSTSMIIGLPLPLGFVLSVVIMTLIGAVFDRLAIYPLKRPSVITLIMITIAASIVIQGIARLVWGTDTYDLIPFSGRIPIRIRGLLFNPNAFGC